MRHLPNIITLLNLFFGCLAVVSILNGNYQEGIIFTLAASVADFADGAVARWLKVSSPLGKELDSLADMVSFGVTPGVIFYVLLKNAFPGGAEYGVHLAAAPGFLVSVFSGLRLAKFNLDTRQTENFIGLATPACTIFALGLLLIFEYDTSALHDFVLQGWLLLLLVALLCWLLVSKIPMFSLKLKSFGWVGNEIKFIFAALAVVELIFLKEAALAAIIFTYILLSLIGRSYFSK